MLISPLFAPIKPPTKLFPLLRMLPLKYEALTSPLFSPTKPPTYLSSPLMVIAVFAVDLNNVPPLSLSPIIEPKVALPETFICEL